MDRVHQTQLSPQTTTENTGLSKEQKASVAEFFKSKQFEEVIQICMPSAQEKNADAMYLIGRAQLHIDIRDQNTNHTVALDWLTQSHDQGSLKATFALGEFYLSETKYEKALTYFNHIDNELFDARNPALSDLKSRASLYIAEINYHVYRNIDEAMRHFSASSKQGNPQGYYIQGVHYESKGHIELAQLNYWAAARVGIEQDGVHQEAEIAFLRLSTFQHKAKL